MSRHSIDIPDPLWEWFQEITGKIVPASAMREALWEYRLAHMIANPPAPPNAAEAIEAARVAVAEASRVMGEPLPKPIPYRLRALGLLPDPFDPQFKAAFEAFIRANAGDVSVALSYLEEKNLNNPKAWLVNWHKQIQASESHDSIEAASR
jgi:hypothetical protein